MNTYIFNIDSTSYKPINIDTNNIKLHIIYKLNQWHILNKLYVGNYSYYPITILIPHNSVNNNSLNNTFLLQILPSYLHLNLLQNIGFFHKISYSHWHIHSNKYIVLKLGINTPLKTIKVKHYKNLLIPAKILIKYLNCNLGLPINYRYLHTSLQHIYRWYISNGFKYVHITYKYMHTIQAVNISIQESKVQNITFICKNNPFHLLQQNIRFHEILLNDFLDIYGKTLNLYHLEKKIDKIRQKYHLCDIQYYIKYKNHNLSIIFLYKPLHKNIMKYSLLCKNILFYNKHNKTLIQIKHDISFFVPLLHSKLYTIFILNYGRFMQQTSIHNTFICIKIYSQLYQKLQFLYKQYDTKIKLQPYKENSIIYNYAFLQYLIMFQFMWINLTSIISILKFNYFQYCQLYFYHFIYNQYSHKIKILKKYYMKFIIYDITYNNIREFNKYIIKWRYFLEISYQLYLHNPIFIDNNIKLFTVYSHHIKTSYMNLWNINFIKQYKHQIILKCEVHGVFGYLIKHISCIQNMSQESYCNVLYNIRKIIVDLEYLVCIHKYNSMYFFINHVPIYKKQTIVWFNKQLLYKFNHIIGLGTQLDLPIAYFPLIRLEIQWLDYDQLTFYTYLISKFHTKIYNS